MLRSLADVQAEFAAALADPAGIIPDGVEGPDGRPSARRFAIYRNNVIVGLVGAVEGVFPAVKRIVGDDFFAAMARAYVTEQPPTSAVLTDYGTTFADFIAEFEPAATLPYLADVARIERAWQEAYHSAEAASLTPADFAGIAEADLPTLTFSLHPSVRVVSSAFPALTIWRMNTGDGPIVPVDLGAGGEDALVVRPEARVDVRLLPAGGAGFIRTLAAGGTLSEAAEVAGEAEGFDLSTNIAGLIDSGSVVGYSIGH